LIIEKYLAKEIIKTFMAVMTVLFLILIGRYLGLYLAWAAEGFISASIVMPMLVLRSISALNLIIPIGFFIAVLLAFGRLYKDNEMTALAAAAVSKGYIMRIVLVISVVFAVFVAMMSMIISPWADFTQFQLQNQAKAEIDSVFAGQFNQISSHGNIMFYTEHFSDDRRSMRKVFVHRELDGVIDIYSASSGHQSINPETGERFLILVDGNRYQGVPGLADFSIQNYKLSAMRVDQKASNEQRYGTRTLPIGKIWRSDNILWQAELQWRMAMPISVILLSALAVLISQTSPRQGRFAKLFTAILIYVLYYNALSIARLWIEQGKASTDVGIWWVHGILLVCIIFLYFRQLGWQWWVDRMFGKAVKKPISIS
jgi:lipopolysaccharide export system permease protein